MDIQVRELLAKAAYHGITRKDIAIRAGIALTSLSNWKEKSPRLSNLNKAINALEELIVEQGADSEKVER